MACIPRDKNLPLLSHPPALYPWTALLPTAPLWSGPAGTAHCNHQEKLSRDSQSQLQQQLFAKMAQSRTHLLQVLLLTLLNSFSTQSNTPTVQYTYFLKGVKLL